jgi:predicted nucleic acid-binding protein
MKRRNVILDTGTLAALLNRKDQHHVWAAERLTEIASPLLTCEAVLSEAHLLA